MYFVNRPVGGIVPPDTDVLSYMRQGMYAEPKIGCCDNGQKTREDRVVLVFNDPKEEDSEWPNHAISYPIEWKTGKQWLRFTALNRKGEPYKVQPIPFTTITQLDPLLKIGIRVFDCGFFPQGKRAGDLCLYGIPNADKETARTYAEMRKVMERYYPVCLDNRVLYEFDILNDKWGDGVYDQEALHLRDYSRGRVKESGPAMMACRIMDYPYYDIEGKPLVYILPTWKPGDYLNTLWQAMIKSPETTYEGLVLKNGSELQLITKNQKSNNSWLKIRYR